MFKIPATVPRISQISSLCGNFHCLEKKSVCFFVLTVGNAKVIHKLFLDTTVPNFERPGTKFWILR